MQEITELNTTRKQLAAEHIYYDGCQTEALCQEAADGIIELAADVLIQIFMSQIGEE